MTTLVPQPTFGPNGFVAPTEAEILAGVTADINSDFGGGLNPALSTPQGQLATTETAVIGDSYAMFIWYCNQVDPALNSGRMQDAIGRFYFMSRIAGAPTTVQITCSGLDGVIIPVGAVAVDDVGNLYICQQQGTISSGNVILPFGCGVNGPIPCAIGAIDGPPYQAITGWDSAYNAADGVLGRNVESQSEFEARRTASVAVNAIGILDAILGAVLAVPNVLDAYVTENDDADPVMFQGVLLGPHSLYVAVLGGNSDAVARAIWSRKAPGCAYNGNTTVIVTDLDPHYNPPPPTYFVTYQIPTVVNFAVFVFLRNNPQIPSNALAQIQNAIIAAFAGADGGSRAQIGSIIFASRYYAPVAMLGAWASIVDIQIGPLGNGGAFTASIAATVMTVTAVAHGVLGIGQLIQDAGILASGTMIVNQLTGSAGSTGTYTVSVSQTVPNEAMTATVLFNDYGMQIDQAPAVAAININLALQG